MTPSVTVTSSQYLWVQTPSSLLVRDEVALTLVLPFPHVDLEGFDFDLTLAFSQWWKKYPIVIP